MIIGVAVSAYTAYVHYNPGALVCPSSGLVNCQDVLTSSYSVIFGIPLAIYSIAWFIVAFLLYAYKKNTLTELWFLIGIGGIIYSIFSMYMIGRTCIYCSALDLIIIASIVLLFKDKD